MIVIPSRVSWLSIIRFFSASLYPGLFATEISHHLKYPGLDVTSGKLQTSIILLVTKNVVHTNSQIRKPVSCANIIPQIYASFLSLAKTALLCICLCPTRNSWSSTTHEYCACACNTSCLCTWGSYSLQLAKKLVTSLTVSLKRPVNAWR